MKQNFKPASPDFAEKVKASFYRQQFMVLLGAELTDVQPGYCEIHLPYKDDLTQQHKYFHGGATATIADTAAGYAAYTLMPSDYDVLSIEFKINLLSPAKGEMLIARGQVLKAGRTLTVCRSDVFAVKGGQEKLIAAAQVTLIGLTDD